MPAPRTRRLLLGTRKRPRRTPAPKPERRRRGTGAHARSPRHRHMTTSVTWDRVPVVISFAEAKQMVETYGFAGSQGMTVLEGQRLVPRDRPSDTVFLFMHPASTLQLLPMPAALADAGLHVL